MSSMAQKADIDPHNIYISMAQLPVNYIDPEKRTYFVQSYGSYKYTGKHNDDQINLYGWKRVDNFKDANLHIKPNVRSFTKGNPSSNSRKIENKDKEGKVTSTSTVYSYSISNTGIGTLYIYGSKNELPAKPKVQKDKKEKTMTKKEKEAANNPFLVGVDTKAAETAADETNMNANSVLPLAYSNSLSNTYNYSTSEHNSSKAAYDDFYRNVNSMTAQHEDSFIKGCTQTTNTIINQLYGYKPYNSYVRFKKLDTDKHPEHDMYKNATEALKTIFAKMRYNQPTTQIEADLEPIISYFKKIVNEYNNAEDKGQRRLKAASLYNLARIYQVLDQHDKTIEIANRMIAEKLDEDAGENFIEESNEIKRQLAFHNMKSRHIVPTSKEEEKDETGEMEAANDKP
jgi:hypothetical protein